MSGDEGFERAKELLRAHFALLYRQAGAEVDPGRLEEIGSIVDEIEDAIEGKFDEMRRKIGASLLDLLADAGDQVDKIFR